MNRAERRKTAGVNKRGLHKLQEGQSKLLIFGSTKWKHSTQTITLKNGGQKKITHTQLIQN
jgi:hypothetical protein